MTETGSSLATLQSLVWSRLRVKRTRESLAHLMCETCPTCGGRGEIKTARTVCYEILRAVLREYHQFKDAKEFTILANQSVIDMFFRRRKRSSGFIRRLNTEADKTSIGK